MKIKKICLIGDFSVGKTSLVKRFVHSVFSEKYMTSVGVKIDTKLVILPDGEEVKLVIWDVAGKDTLSAIDEKYLKGAKGYLLVVDGTRAETLDSALLLDKQAQLLLGNVDRVLMLNKSDLQSSWDITDETIQHVNTRFPKVFFSSALDGRSVEDAFQYIAQQ